MSRSDTRRASDEGTAGGGRNTRNICNTRKGLGLSLLAAATFGTSGAFADSLLKVGWSPAGVVLARISLAAVFLTVPAIISLRGRWGLLRANARMIISFGLIAIAACQVTYFNAVARMSVGIALTTSVSSPVPAWKVRVPTAAAP